MALFHTLKVCIRSLVSACETKHPNLSELKVLFSSKPENWFFFFFFFASLQEYFEQEGRHTEIPLQEKIPLSIRINGMVSTATFLKMQTRCRQSENFLNLHFLHTFLTTSFFLWFPTQLIIKTAYSASVWKSYFTPVTLPVLTLLFSSFLVLL